MFRVYMQTMFFFYNDTTYYQPLNSSERQTKCKKPGPKKQNAVFTWIKCLLKNILRRVASFIGENVLTEKSLVGQNRRNIRNRHFSPKKYSFVGEGFSDEGFANNLALPRKQYTSHNRANFLVVSQSQLLLTLFWWMLRCASMSCKHSSTQYYTFYHF